MKWIEYEKRKPKSAGLYAISKRLIDPEEGLLIAYFDGMGFCDPYHKQTQEKVYWEGAMWAVMDWGRDGDESE